MLIVVSSLALILAERVLRKRFFAWSLLLSIGLEFVDRAPRRYGVLLRSWGSLRFVNRQSRLARATNGSSRPDDAMGTYLVELLAAMTAHDRFTRGHGERVRTYATLLAEELGSTKEEAQLIGWGARLHDVGKMGVERRLLTKPAGLTDEETAQVQEHSATGDGYMAPLEPWLGNAVYAARDHHRMFDGGGYPELGSEQLARHRQ